MKDISEINGYHAHIYYDLERIEDAKILAKGCSDLYGVEVGRFHEGPVGPHPSPSCQLTVTVEQFAFVLPWLSLNRNGLTLFIHPETSNALLDHTDFVIWLGKQYDVSLELFK